MLNTLPEEILNIIFMNVNLGNIKYSKLLNKKINYIIHDKMIIEKHNKHFKNKYGRYDKFLSSIGKNLDNLLSLNSINMFDIAAQSGNN